MVVNNSTPKIIEAYPTSLQQMKKSGYSKMVMKFSSERCPPCRQLQQWLSTYTPPASFPLFQFKSENEDQTDVMSTLCSMYDVSSIPRVVFVDSNLNVLDSIVGYRPDEFDKLVKKHFS